MLELIVRQGTKSPKGKINEDAKFIDKRRNIYLVADGIGGHPLPERASQIAVLSCYQKLMKTRFKYKKDILGIIGSAMEYANNVLCALSDKLPEFISENKRAGTTLDVIYFYKNSAYMGHIGDGRVYRLRNSRLMQLTEDHSLVESDLEEGVQKLRERFGLGGLYEYVGNSTRFNPQLKRIKLKRKDVILITTDGLTKMLFNSEISQTLRKTSFKRSVRTLLKASNYPIKLVKYYCKKKKITHEEALSKLVNDDFVTMILIKVRYMR